MVLTDEEKEVLRRVLAMITKSRDKPVKISPEDVGKLQTLLGKLDHRPTIREAREIRRKAQEDANQKED
jgi:hypothetical protein